jgi:hypothetical protein
MSKEKDSFFMDIGNTKPFFKAGFQGFAGSGKTFTSALLAIGLHQHIKSKKPIVFVDTEKAAKFLKPLFDKAGISVLLRETRSPADLKITMGKMSEGISDILMIDSISHIWENFLEAFKKRVNRKDIQFQDWGIIKPDWKKTFSDPFVNGKYHIFMCGRAGYEYESEINERGRREIHKSGVKMKVEGETAYEPDVLVNMERIQEMDGAHIKRVIRRANIIKDRSDQIDGKLFENPTYKDFLPAINVILKAPVELETTAEKDSTELFDTGDGLNKYLREKKKILEEIDGTLKAHYPTTSTKDKTARSKALQTVFETYSKTKIEGLSLEKLKDGYSRLVDYINGKADDGDIPI